MTDHALACLKLRLCDARSAAVREALEHYGNAPEAWHALRQRDRSLERGLRAKHTLLERGLAWLQEPGSHLLAWHEADYPPALRHVASPPPFLFVREATLSSGWATGTYTITGEEAFRAGHFKDNPIFPASIMLEALGPRAVMRDGGVLRGGLVPGDPRAGHHDPALIA